MAEYKDGQTATHPKTGQRIVFRGGQWINDGGPTSGGATASATEAERKAASFLIRGVGAEGTYKAQGLGPRSVVGQKLHDLVPNALNSWLPSSIGNSARRQVADTTQDEFIAASLRQDSGAAIPEQELERQRRIYFPMPGDGPEAIQAKARARERALQGLHQSAGRLAPGALQKVRQQAASMRSKKPKGDGWKVEVVE